MNALQFTPVMREAHLPAENELPIRELSGIGASYALRLHHNGDLKATRLETGDETLADLSSDHEEGTVVALMRHCCDSRDSAWMLAVCMNRVGLNGLTPPLAVTIIEPGELLTIGDRCWLISSLWQPEPVEAPAELRDKPCPVCGGELGRAPVVQCGCGRWMHLENPSAPYDKEALNCYMSAGTCGGCGRRATLEPQMFPEVSDRLTCEPVDADEFAWQ